MTKSPSTSSNNSNQMNELDDLSNKLSSIALQPNSEASTSAPSEANDQSEIQILEGLREIIEKLNIE
jgi:hypothetical protein